MQIESTLTQSSFSRSHSSHIQNLLRSNSSLLLSGPRGCGKTTFIQSLLQRLNISYIKVNSILGEKKHNFIKIIWTQLKKLFQYPHPSSSISFESLIKSLQLLKQESPQQYARVKEKGVVYILADNIEELHVTEKFIGSMFAFRESLDLQLAFVFCGVNANNRIMLYEKPICDIISIMMPRPDRDFMEQVVRGHNRAYLQEQLGQLCQQCSSKEIRQELKHTERILTEFTKYVMDGIILIECDLLHIKRLTRCLAERLVTYYENMIEKVNNSDQSKSKGRERERDRDGNREKDKDRERDEEKYKLHSVLHDNFFREYFNKICEYGSEKAWEVSKKIEYQDNIDDQYFQKKLFYPQLIKTSIFLAEICPEAEDNRRFKEYRRATKRAAELKQLRTKVKKHHPFRIIAIAESLESQTKPNNKERCLDCHSIDFYSCFQYLRNQGQLKFVGKSGGFGVGKLQSKTNEQDALDFMKETGLKMEQFKV